MDQYDEQITSNVSKYESDADDDGEPVDMKDKLKGWRKQQKKYLAKAQAGDVTSLQQTIEKQSAKVEKAKGQVQEGHKHGHKKSEEYIAYKEHKVEWTKRALQMAKLAAEFSKRGWKVELASLKRQMKKDLLSS